MPSPPCSPKTAPIPGRRFFAGFYWASTTAVQPYGVRADSRPRIPPARTCSFSACPNGKRAGRCSRNWAMQHGSRPGLSGWENGISSRNADTMFAVFKRKQRLVAVFLPVAGTDVETVVRTARKITHYGRYGRLSFKGGANISKGIGEVHGSPLVVDLRNDS
jgi:hypothetical protein